MTRRATQPLHSEVFAYALENNLLLPEAKRRLTEERRLTVESRRTAFAEIRAVMEKRRRPLIRHNVPASFSNFDAPWMQRN